ncbi:MAG TPA: hypothetical protein VIK04_12970 [Solirubrobacteraceae bacterium]
MRTSGHGLSIEVPRGWEARIARRPESAPFLHIANFALRPDTGAFGAAVTERMGADGAFAALVEYRIDDRVTAGAGLFAAAWSPRLRVGDFARAQVQVARPGHLGRQRFFTAAGRPFCLYAVVSPVRVRPARLVGQLAAVMATLRFEG